MRGDEGREDGVAIGIFGIAIEFWRLGTEVGKGCGRLLEEGEDFESFLGALLGISAEGAGVR